MKKFFDSPGIYSLLWCLYYMQGALYPEGSIISQGILAIFLLISLYYFVLVYKMPALPSAIKAMQRLAILFAVYGIWRLFADTTGWLSNNASTTYFKEYEVSILPIFSMYYFARNKMIDAQWFYRFFFVFFVTAIVSFFYSSEMAKIRFDSDEIVNNAGYFVASLMPLLLFMRKRLVIQYGALIIIVFLVIQGMKRGAILTAGVGSVWFLLRSIRESSGKKKFTIIFLSAIIVVGAIYYFNESLSTSLYMQKRLERTMEGDMSNRENIYPAFIHYFFDNANPLQLLFGFGADGTLRNMGNFAHQDWIEILMNEGIFGFCLLLSFWVAMVRTFFSTRGMCNGNIQFVVGLFILLFLIKSMFSMSINGMTLFSTSALAYALAAIDDNQIQEDLANF